MSYDPEVVSDLAFSSSFSSSSDERDCAAARPPGNTWDRVSTQWQGTWSEQRQSLRGATAWARNHAIIAQTGAAATTAYAAGLARLYAAGGFSDWYLPSTWELNMCYNSAAIVNKILGSTNGFSNLFYWSSTEFSSTNANGINFSTSVQSSFGKSTNGGIYVRAVRIHTI